MKEQLSREPSDQEPKPAKSMEVFRSNTFISECGLL